MNTIPSTDLIAKPTSNETLPPGHVWKSKPNSTKPNPRRKRAPRNPQFAYLFAYLFA